MKPKKSGFTLIELMISLALLAIILVLVNSIFIPSQKNISKTQVKSDLQLQAEQILDYINKSGMQAQKVQKIIGDSDYLTTNTANVSINNIIFSNGSESYAFTLTNFDSTNNSYELYYGEQPVGANKSIGKYVKDMKVSIINGDASTTYGSCSALKITIYLSKKISNNEVYNYDVTTNVYFRNN